MGYGIVVSSLQPLFSLVGSVLSPIYISTQACRRYGQNAGRCSHATADNRAAGTAVVGSYTHAWQLQKPQSPSIPTRRVTGGISTAAVKAGMWRATDVEYYSSMDPRWIPPIRYAIACSDRDGRGESLHRTCLMQLYRSLSSAAQQNHVTLVKLILLHVD